MASHTDDMMDEVTFDTVVALDDTGTSWEGTFLNEDVRGMDGNDTLWGDRGGPGENDGPSHDRINGNKGNDVVFGGIGDDTVRGGMGDDEVHGEAGDDMVHGDKGDDELHGDAGDDMMYGGDGNDTIHGDAGNDMISGEDGHDTMYGGDGDDTLRGGMGNDSIHGGNGDDMIYGGMGADFISGGDGDDMILGLDQTDQIRGDGGNDNINGNKGNDTLFGGAGSDNIHGGQNDDLIYGGYETVPTAITGLAGVVGDTMGDALYGDLGNDRIFAGDIVGDADVYQDGAGSTQLDFENAKVTFVRGNMLDGGHGNDSLYGAEGNDTLIGGHDNDLLIDGGGVDRLDGGSGNDMLYGAHVITHTAIGADVAAPAAVTDAAIDAGGNVLTGGDGDDILRSVVRANNGASGKADTLMGGDDNDQLIVAALLTDADGTDPTEGILTTNMNVGLVLQGGAGKDVFDISAVFGSGTGNSIIEIKDYDGALDRTVDTVKIGTGNTAPVFATDGSQFDTDLSDGMTANTIYQGNGYSLVHVGTNTYLKFVGVSAEDISAGAVTFVA